MFILMFGSCLLLGHEPLWLFWRMHLCAYVCAYFALACILTYAFACSCLFVGSHSFAYIWPRFSMFPFVICLCLRWILHLLFVLVHFGATSMLVCAYICAYVYTYICAYVCACMLTFVLASVLTSMLTFTLTLCSRVFWLTLLLAPACSWALTLLPEFGPVLASYHWSYAYA